MPKTKWDTILLVFLVLVACSKSDSMQSDNTTDLVTAKRVYGQSGIFTSGSQNTNGLSANSLCSARGVTVASDGIYVADGCNNRVLYFPGTSTTATRVYGQLGNFNTSTANNGGISANSLNGPLGVAVDSGGVYIVDTNNNRVLYYSGTSTTATRVYGQGGSFTTATANNGGLSANSINNPFGIAVDSGGVYVADFSNSRVLYFAGTSTTATRVYGQGGNFASATYNNGGVSANSIAGPAALAVDASGLYIADSGNHRVLYFVGTSTTATRVYGQTGSFTTNSANQGGISADSLNGPFGITLNGSGVFISDRSNNRILFYSSNSTSASRVYGQGNSFASTTANKGGINASSLNDPWGITADSTGLYIADQGNSRVLFY